MAVLVSVTVKNQTQDGYDGVLTAVQELVKKAPGFIMHCAYAAENEWRLMEVWETKEHSDRWFAKDVVPNLPPGLHPKRSYQELHSLVTPAEQRG